MEGSGHERTWKNPCKHGTATHDREMSSVVFGRRRGDRVFAATSRFPRLQPAPRTSSWITATSVEATRYCDLQDFYGAYRDRTGDLRLAKPDMAFRASPGPVGD